MSQGWGPLGVGVLYDDDGDDVYLGEAGVQGAASMGIGLLLDGGDDDEHRTFANSQGFAYVQAVGIAWDAGGGDVWCADPGKAAAGARRARCSPPRPEDGMRCLPQGAGSGLPSVGPSTGRPGGLGVLRDAGGDDAYTASAVADGGGSWQGTGLLLDGGGHDTYDA